MTAVPAATILMLRDGPSGLEVFMVVRHHQIDFASGALVFPGGKISAGDREVRDLCTGDEGLIDSQLALHVGAIREAFEECGILLARPLNSSDLISGEELQRLGPLRQPLSVGELTIRDFLLQQKLILACDLLTRFSHWITPEMMPKRFDTQFYVAAAPQDHLAIHDGFESVDSIWISPEQAIKEADDGKRTVIFPTRMNIEMLGNSDSVEAALIDADNRDIVTVMPWTEKRDDGNYLCIPAAAGYRVSEEKMETR